MTFPESLGKTPPLQSPKKWKVSKRTAGIAKPIYFQPRFSHKSNIKCDNINQLDKYPRENLNS